MRRQAAAFHDVRACIESAIGVTAVERCNLRLFSNC
jgi:hypothetical protein